MSDIGAIGRNMPASIPAKAGVDRKTAPAGEESGGIDTGDKITLKGALKKAGKFALGTAIATVVAPLNAVERALDGSMDAGERGLGVEGPQKGVTKNLQKIAMPLSSIAGMIMGMPLGIPGMMAGAMMAPGAAGGLIAGGKGLLGGAKKGFTLTKAVARKLEEKVSGKSGRLSGKAAKIAAAVAMGAVAIPGFALGLSLLSGLNFARKAININPAPKNNAEVAGTLAKEGTLLYGFLSGAAEAGPGLAATSAGGIATVGSFATGAAGVIEGVKGFADGVKASCKVAGDIVNDK